MLLFGAEIFVFQLLSKDIKVKTYRIIILPFVLYECETWSPTVSEELRLRIFRYRVLRKVFGPKRGDVMGQWQKQHNETLYDLQSPNVWVIKSRRMGWVGHVGHVGNTRGVYRILVGRSEGRRPLGRPRCRWCGDIKMDLQEVGGGLCLD